MFIFICIMILIDPWIKVKINVVIMIIICVTKYIWSINYSRIFERLLAVKQKTGSFIIVQLS